MSQPTAYTIFQQPIPSGWEEVFHEAQPDLENIEHLLKQTGKTFVPYQNELFTAFNLTPLSQVKAVIIGQDPYHNFDNTTGLPQAHGLAFSCRGKVQSSLQNIYKELRRERMEYIKSQGMDYDGWQPPEHGMLTNWAKQGVLLINSSLTTEPQVAGAHPHLWKPFITKVIEAVNRTNPECIYLLWGRHAQGYADGSKSILSNRNPQFIATHPSGLSANRQPNSDRDPPAFIGCDCFIKANEALIGQGRKPVDWWQLI